HGEMKVLPASPLRQAAWRPVPGPSPAIDVPDWAGTGTLHVPGSDSGLVTRAAFKAVWPQANTCGGGFDSHPLPPHPVGYREIETDARFARPRRWGRHRAGTTVAL